MHDIDSDLTDARNVLLCAPSLSGGEREVCSDLLLPDDPGNASVLWVTFRRDAVACVDQWSAETDEQPRNAGVIAVGDTGEGVDAGWATVETVNSASDLTGLGIAIGEFLSDWDGEIVVCFDSLTAMLQYVDVETAYEFLHTIAGQLYNADARAHFHIDPTAHDQQTVESLTSLFDAAVSVEGDDVSVRKRQLLQ
ncbi:MAG: hypothetical protein ABEJ40_09830 [Haloarculaceae archaeon]